MTDAAVDPRAVFEAISTVRARITALAGDRPVELIAVTKGFGVDAIRAAVAAGCTSVGENYAQELIAKVAELEPTIRPRIHFIGQLQRNKVRQLVDVVDVWQTVDRDSLIDEIARRVPGAEVFVQVDATDEPGKGGCPPGEVAARVERCRSLGLRPLGLMTVGPTSQDRTATAVAFGLVRRLADDNGLSGCSMGMSNDLDLAVEHGATHVRIGSALFGARPHPRARIG